MQITKFIKLVYHGNLEQYTWKHYLINRAPWSPINPSPLPPNPHTLLTSVLTRGGASLFCAANDVIRQQSLHILLIQQKK